MPSYLIDYTCRRNGQPAAAQTVAHYDIEDLTLAQAKQAGVDAAVEQVARDQGHDITDVNVTSIRRFAN